jgi:drug/metabolite transporter (DMT)-like permease
MPSRAPGRSPQAKGILITGTGGVVLSFEGVIVQALDVSQWTILFCRGPLMAAGFLLIFWRGWAREGGLPGLLGGLRAVGGWGPWAASRLPLAAAALFAIDNVLFIVALRTTSVANTLVILSTVPVWAALLGRLLLGEPVGARTWAVIVAVVAGVVAIVSGSLGHGRPLGDLAALGAAMSIAGTLVIIRRARTVVMLPSMALGALVAGLAAAPLADLGTVGGRDALLLVLLGLVIVPVAFGCISIGPRYLPAHEVGLLMLLEPVLGPLWVWAILGRAPALRTVAGGTVILAALVTNSVLGIRRRSDSGPSGHQAQALP